MRCVGTSRLWANVSVVAPVCVAVLVGACTTERTASTDTADSKPDDRPAGIYHLSDIRTPEHGWSLVELLSRSEIIEVGLEFEHAAMARLGRRPKSYVRGHATVAGLRHADVGIKFKGNRSLRTWTGKPSFVVHFAKYERQQRLLGRKKLILNNMVEDPTMMREVLAYRVYRALGVPAPRTAFARVTVNGEPFGIYLALEPVDRQLMASQLESAPGVLYEGEFGCDLYPDDALSMHLEAGSDPGREHLRALTAAAAGPISELLSETGPLDRERVMTYLAVGAVIGDFDGYPHVHNYFLYRDPSRDVWLLAPWGQDRVFRDDTGVFEGDSLLMRKCRADAECRRAFAVAVYRASEAIERMQLSARVDELTARLDAAGAASSPRLEHDPGEVRRARAALRRYLADRPREVRRQLACLEPDGDQLRELDRDGDGHGCGDCDDREPSTHPGAAEPCDGIDNDCDGLIDDAPACGCPAIVIDGASYYLCDLPMPWEDAAAFCDAAGWTLATVPDRRTSERLHRAAIARRSADWWIGLADRKRETEPSWHAGGAVEFTNWADGEPDHYVCGQDCAALREAGAGEWRDAHCAEPRPFICAGRRHTGEPAP